MNKVVVITAEIGPHFLLQSLHKTLHTVQQRTNNDGDDDDDDNDYHIQVRDSEIQKSFLALTILILNPCAF